tara:strand:+ start:754 stop:924 length:171 start_codon:yes stop_codon:yes gene_type:complete
MNDIYNNQNLKEDLQRLEQMKSENPEEYKKLLLDLNDTLKKNIEISKEAIDTISTN